jgi:hypothetical protein
MPCCILGGPEPCPSLHPTGSDWAMAGLSLVRGPLGRGLGGKVARQLSSTAAPGAKAFPVLKDEVAAWSDDFKRNKGEMDRLVAELDAKVAETREGESGAASHRVVGSLGPGMTRSRHGPSGIAKLSAYGSCGCYKIAQRDVVGWQEEARRRGRVTRSARSCSCATGSRRCLTRAPPFSR